MNALYWTFPTLMFASILVGWAAEVTAVRLSAGIALAVLAWLQCAPEFAVEATIAWSRNTHLALANLTGSLRLLLGLGWPMVFLIAWVFRSKRQHKKGWFEIVLKPTFAVEAVGLAIPVLYFLIIVAKGTWTTVDGIVLCSFYGFYFYLLNRQRKVFPEAVEEVNELEKIDDEDGWVVENILKLPSSYQTACALGLFALGGGLLLITVHPFVDALKATATSLGVSEYLFIQWIAPVASEFPEKVTAFGWARKPRKVPMAIVNMLSSVTSQWTLLAGLVPIVFSMSAGHFFTITLEPFQRSEILLTVAQSALVVIFLADLRIKSFEAIGLFLLWLVQMFYPTAREWLVYVYLAWIFLESVRLAFHPRDCMAWKSLLKVVFASPNSASRRK